ncbi:DUF6879 family protein [Streptomyces sp. CBMA29]|uniref:DUF6879 family protein n=1 Tax=Streptomyces sp. CBMA29 TaxID=1896314 RepID=UPI001661D058|nr:DUF6879 family protein [Streptomyces sp. CBMA29]MBD0738635.1 hypothetical protein [Streptomyces sp. CBMA29]
MLDLHAPVLPLGQGEPLTDDEYVRDFRARRAAIRNGDSWKLERLQHFEEEDSPSREAQRQGDWETALRLMEARRDAFREAAQDDERRGSPFHRVRVVEEPLTPYLQWELHYLRQRAQCGHRIRVVQAGVFAAAETDRLLPELTILDDRTLYRVMYTEAGVAEGAVRFTDSAIVEPWVSFIRDAYAVGEDVTLYFDRVVARLPPPPAA